MPGTIPIQTNRKKWIRSSGTLSGPFLSRTVDIPIIVKRIRNEEQLKATELKHKKILLRKVLLVTQRHVVGFMAKGGEGYVKIHHR